MSLDLSSIPNAPGVYLMRDRTGAVIYTGKAVDLRKRVSSYFQKRTLPPRIASLIANIQRFDYIVTQNEQEALVLENKLIKKFQPRYNTLLRDDKTYPYLVLTVNEGFPRLFLTRNKRNDKNLYFGPYPFVAQVQGLVKWLVRNFGLRPCRENLGGAVTPRIRKRFESCLYLHIDKCSAPCIGNIRKREYDRSVHKLKLFLNGKHNNLINIWKREMKRASDSRSFEVASGLRDRIYALENIYERVRFRKIEEKDLVSTIKGTRALSDLKKVLGLKKVPLTVEAFDISNITGKYAFGSMVRFKNGIPDKKNYRIFRIKTISGSNDSGMIGETVRRRYRRIVEDDGILPDLILVDGGRAQLMSAVSSLNDIGIKGVDCASLAKREEEVYLPDRDKPLVLARDGAALQMLMRIRDESHRFAVSFYRRKHRKELLNGRST